MKLLNLLKMLLAMTVVLAIAGCGGSEPDADVLTLESGQLIRVTSDINADFMPSAIGEGEPEPGCVKNFSIFASIAVSPAPVPESLVPTSVSVFSGSQLVWAGSFEPNQTWLESPGKLRTAAHGCPLIPISSNMQGMPMRARLTLALDGVPFTMSAPTVPLSTSW